MTAKRDEMVAKFENALRQAAELQDVGPFISLVENQLFYSSDNLRERLINKASFREALKNWVGKLVSFSISLEIKETIIVWPGNTIVFVWHMFHISNRGRENSRRLLRKGISVFKEYPPSFEGDRSHLGFYYLLEEYEPLPDLILTGLKCPDCMVLLHLLDDGCGLFCRSCGFWKAY